MISSVAFTACSGTVCSVDGSMTTVALLSGVWCEAEAVISFQAAQKTQHVTQYRPHHGLNKNKNLNVHSLLILKRGRVKKA